MQKLWKLPKLKAERWVEALRSGEYVQGHGWLKDGPGRYCCLGVYADTLGLEIEPMEYTELTGNSDRIEALFIPDLPKALDCYIGNTVAETSLANILIAINDEHGFSTFPEDIWDLDIIYMINSGIKDNSFNTIADFIETHVEFV